MDIDFVTFIGPNSSEYAEYLKHTGEVFASGKHNIKWKCVESVGVDRLPDGFECILKAPNASHNSMNHGVAMNMALKHIESDYVVFIDVDMAVVYPNWDDVVVNELNKHDCFGVSYSDKIKYPNFPTVYFFAFRKHILDKADLDFTPKIIPNSEKPFRYAISKEEAPLFKMAPGSLMKCDTGWRLPLIIRGAGFTANSMPMVMMGSKKAQLPFENKQHRSLCMKKPGHMYEWHYKGKVFATHKQACRVHPLDGTWGGAWKRRIDLYIERTK